MPLGANFEFKVDGGVVAMTADSWLDSSTLRFTAFAPSAPSVGVTAELLNEDINLHALGGEIVLPFGPETLDAG